MFDLDRVNLYLFIPVCTLSPTCNSDITIVLPFPRLSMADDGKHPVSYTHISSSSTGQQQSAIEPDL